MKCKTRTSCLIATAAWLLLPGPAFAAVGGENAPAVARPQQKPAPPSLDDLDAAVRRALLPRFKRSSEIGDSPFGTHTCSTLSEGMGDPQVLIRDISRAGFKWVKDYIPAGNMPAGADPEDFLAQWNQPKPSGVAYLELARKSKLNVLLRLNQLSVAGKPPATPEARRLFARWCRLQVRHYKQWVKDWELGNEPNGGNEHPLIKPEDYALLCKEAYREIKAEDPQARVWVGATAMLQCLHDWPYPWIRKALAADLGGDGFSIHPYRQPYVRLNFPEHGSQFHPWNFWPDYAAQIADLREAIDHGKLVAGADGHVPIAATEEGWPTNLSDHTWKQEISFLTQAKYEQRAMLLDFWLGIRPRINFIFTRSFQNIYHVEAQFQLVEPYQSNIMNWADPENRDALFRPAYLAAAAVCANVDDTLKKTSQPVEVPAAEKLNLQIMTFQREHAELGLVEVVILLWAGVPAEDDFEPRPLAVTLPGQAPSLASLPIGYSLLPVGVKYSTMDDFNWGVKTLPCKMTGGSVTLAEVPVSDAPYLIKYVRRAP